VDGRDVVDRIVDGDRLDRLRPVGDDDLEDDVAAVADARSDVGAVPLELVVVVVELSPST